MIINFIVLSTYVFNSADFVYSTIVYMYVCMYVAAVLVRSYPNASMELQFRATGYETVKHHSYVHTYNT